MDIRELLNHIRAGSSDRQIAQDVKIDRRTVKRYREWAEEQGLLEGSLPGLGDLLALQNETMPSISFGRKSCSLRWKVEPQDTW